MCAKIEFGNYFRVSVSPLSGAAGVQLARKHPPPPTRPKRAPHREATRPLSSFRHQRFAVGVSRQVKTDIALHMDPRLLAGNRRLVFRSTEQTGARNVKSPRMLGGVGVKAPLERCSVGIFGNCVSLRDLASTDNRTASVPENSRSRACPQRFQ